jgi:hypothetical protein
MHSAINMNISGQGNKKNSNFKNNTLRSMLLRTKKNAALFVTVWLYSILILGKKKPKYN